MLRIGSMLASLLACLISIGCSPVTSGSPIGALIGDEDGATRAAVAAMNGAWVIEGPEDAGPVLEVRALSEGDLAVAKLDWDEDAQSFRSTETTAKVRKLNGRLLVNVLRVRDNLGAPEAWELYLVRSVDDRRVQLLPADEGTFAAAVRAGTLAGTVEVNDVGEISQVHLASPDKTEAFLKGQSKLESCFRADGYSLRRITRARKP